MAREPVAPRSAAEGPTRFMICGMPRSGTTLLAEQIARNPGFHVGPESHVLSIAAALGIHGAITAADRDRVLDAIARDAPLRTQFNAVDLAQLPRVGRLTSLSSCSTWRVSARVMTRSSAKDSTTH